MNKEERYPHHDLVEYDGDCDTFAESLNHRYEEGDTKVVKPRMYHHLDEVPTIYRKNEYHEWVFYKQPSTWPMYNTADGKISQKTITGSYNLPDFPNKDADYILPIINTALLSRGRTEKLRVKRVKPACIRREEEEL